MSPDDRFAPSRPLEDLASDAIVRGRALRRRYTLVERVAPVTVVAVMVVAATGSLLVGEGDRSQVRTTDRAGVEQPDPSDERRQEIGAGRGPGPSADLPSLDRPQGVAPAPPEAPPPTPPGSVSGAPTTHTTTVARSVIGRVAFTGNAGGSIVLFTAEADGSATRQITSGPGNALWPTWAPDGTTIAYYSDRDGTNRIYVVDTATTSARRVTNLDGDHATQPAWSTSGEIAFTRFARPIAQTAVAPANPKGIWVVRPDGSGLRQLLTEGAQPAWSPDGRRLAFVTATGLHVLDPATGATRHIAADANVPRWSPDGRELAFGRVVDGREQIFVVNVDGTGERQLITSDHHDSLPEWTPDGSQVVFTRDADGRAGSVNCTRPSSCRAGGPEPSGLWILQVDGGDPRPLFPTTSRGDYNARFAPRPS